MPGHAICRYTKRQMATAVQKATLLADSIAELGGEKTLGRKIRDEQDLLASIREGFPQQVVGEVSRAAQVTIKELSESLALSQRSLQRRKDGRLATHESDRIYRLARVLALAKRTFGDEEKALRWLRKPVRALGGGTPLEALDTEAGSNLVETVLGRIEYGVYS